MTVMNTPNKADGSPQDGRKTAAKSGPVLGGVRRRPRGPLFWLFFAGGYRTFWPAPAAANRFAQVLYYLRLVIWTANRSYQRRWLLWLVRWVLTVTVLIYLCVVIGAVVYVAALHVGLWFR